jgi:hypothetical protein
MALAVLGTGAAAANAQVSQETIKITSVGHTQYHGNYVGVYKAQVTSDPGHPTIDIYCVDFLHHAQLNTPYTMNVSFLGGDLSHTRLGNAGLAQYEQAGFLALQFGSPANSANWGDIHAAMWRIVTPNASTSLPSYMFTSNVDYWVTYAQTHYNTSGLDYSRFSVLTDINAYGQRGGMQEMITTTPEPKTFILFGTGLMTLGALSVGLKRV